MDETLVFPDGSKIRELRRKRGWSQVELAEAAKVSKDTVWRWEKGYPAQRTYIRDLARALGAEWDELVVVEPTTTNRGTSDRPTVLAPLPIRQIPAKKKPQLPRISTAKLPSTSPVLFGRTRELHALDAAWHNPSSNILVIIGWGGTGKTALVNAWLNEFSQDNYRGAEALFGWSFYSQGTREGTQASADAFLPAALEWFGDPIPDRGSPWDKGERLAQIIKRQRNLLVLDGLEPLQFPPGEAGGRLRDPGLRSLVRELGRHNMGLCIITTRIAVDDLKDFVGHSVTVLDLSNLDLQSATTYLRSLGAQGATSELEAAAKEYDCHALALTLLGRFTATVLAGDIRRRDTLPPLDSEIKQGAHARRINRAYQLWFDGKPELDVLHLLGLFDAPAETSAISAVLGGTMIPGLTNSLHGIDNLQWQLLLASLREARLIEPDIQHTETLDCHPLVREYFSQSLKMSNPLAWRLGHARLYEYYKTAVQPLPSSMEEMYPLFQAVAHGCLAGQYQDSFSQVYRGRIQRLDQYYNSRILGAIGAELTALSYFFTSPWTIPVAELDEYDKSFVLSAAGFRLRALGRLAEAVESMNRALRLRLQLQAWKDAAYSAASIGEIHLLMGNISLALDLTSTAIEYADRSADTGQRVLSRSEQASALHAAGRLDESQLRFAEAEAIQRLSPQAYPYLYSVDGSFYCDLLIDKGAYGDVFARGKSALDIAEANNWLLEIGLAYLMMGRAQVLLSLHGTVVENNPLIYLNASVTYLHRASRRSHLARAILARAIAFAVQKEFDRAQEEISDALAIAKEGEMRLYEMDCEICRACLIWLNGDRDSALAILDVVSHTAEQAHYGRREGYLMRLKNSARDVEAALRIFATL